MSFLEDSHFQELFLQKQAIRQRLQALQEYAGELAHWSRELAIQTPLRYEDWMQRRDLDGKLIDYGLHPALLAIFREREAELVAELAALSMQHDVPNGGPNAR